MKPRFLSETGNYFTSSFERTFLRAFPRPVFLVQRSHSFFQPALSPFLVSFCTAHNVFHGLNTNYVRVGILVTLVNVESSTSKNVVRSLRLVLLLPTVTPSIHGYILDNDLSFPLSLFLPLILSPSCSLRIDFTQRNIHSPTIIGIVHRRKN